MDMSGGSSNHSIGEGEGKRLGNSGSRTARGRSPNSPMNETRIPQLRRVGTRRFLHNPAPTQYNSHAEAMLHGGRRNPPPVLHRYGARYTLAEMATANDRTDALARENDMAASCEKYEGDRKRQRLNPIYEESETESMCSAVEDVKKFLLFDAMGALQNLETQIRQAATPQGRYRSLSGSFRSTPVAGEAEKLATAMAMSLEAEEEDCRHPSVDALRMLSVEQRQDSLVKWPVGYSAACAVCEKVIGIGEGYKRCRMCHHTCCRRCEWTLKYGGGGY